MPHKKRIVFILPFLYRLQRGIERSGINLANQLAQEGHEITIFTWGYKGRSAPENLDPHIGIFKVPWFRYFQRFWAKWFYLVKLLFGRYDIVNIYYAGHGEALPVRWAKKWKNFTLTFIVGYPVEQVPHRFEEFNKLKLSHLLDAILVKSPFMKPGVEQFFDRPVSIVPNGVDTAWFNPNHTDEETVKKQWEIPNDAWVFVTVAALEERKGIQHVIRLMANLKVEGYNVHYFIVGDGPFFEELEALVKEKGLTDQVHFTGSLKEVRPYYKVADTSFLLAYGEGLPNTLLESWAMATPIVVSEHPPFPDLVDANTALMVNEKESDKLKKRVTYLLENPEERHKLAENGRQLVEKQYSWEAVAHQYLASVEQH